MYGSGCWTVDGTVERTYECSRNENVKADECSDWRKQNKKNR